MKRYSCAAALAVLLVTLAPVCISNGAGGEIDLIQSYPLIQEGNFNYVELTCKDRRSPAATCEEFEEPFFYHNGTDIRKLLNVSDCYNGSIDFTLSQRTEGNFTCSINGTQSNTVALAAQPEGQPFSEHRVQHVQLQSSEEQKTILLACDIVPGTLRDSYTAVWLEISPGSRHVIRNVTHCPTFNLMLNITSSMKDYQYQCVVKINHNGLIVRSYEGAKITLNVTIDMENSSRSDGLSRASIVSLSFFIPTVITVVLIAILVICIYMGNRYMGQNCLFTKFQTLQWTELNNTGIYASDVIDNPVHNVGDVSIELHVGESSELDSVLVRADPSPQISDKSSLDQNSDLEMSTKSYEGEAHSTVYVNKSVVATVLGDQYLDASVETQSKEIMHQGCPITEVTAAYTSDSSNHMPTSHSQSQASLIHCGFPCSVSENEASCTTQNSPVTFQSSQWIFDTENSESKKAAPPIDFHEEKDMFLSDCDYGAGLSGHYSASQFSTDSASMKFADVNTGCYGYLPDKRHAYSLSQISTTGDDSQTGLSQSNKGKSTQKKDRGHTEGQGKKKTKKEKSLHLDVRSGDSGIGQSLSPMKSLSPKQHISLTQGPPHCSNMLMMHDIYTHDVNSQRVDSLARQNRVHRSASNPNRMHCMTVANKSKHRAQNMTDCSLTETHTFPRKKKFRKPPSSSQGCQLAQHEQAPTVPKCIRPTATLHNCTSEGLVYTDESIGLTLAITKGAIADGDNLTIDIGVALHGPFHYPEGVRPISPVLWICVRENEFYQFKIPIEVTMQHFLSIDSNDDVALMGLRFMKASHKANAYGKYEFYCQNGNQWFEPNTRYGTLYSKHFCFQCIVGSISELTLRNSNFCLFGTLPNTFVYDRPMYIFFFVTFFLHACLETVRRQIATIPELAYCEYSEVKTEFQFEQSTSSPEITIKLPQNLSGGWQLGIQFKKKITLKDIDFMGRDRDELQLKESEGMYPPHFRVVIDGKHTFEKATGHLTFSGTTSDLVFDILLVPPTLTMGPRSTSQASLHLPPVAEGLPPLTLTDLLNLVVVNIPSKWKLFGILVGVPDQLFDTYPIHNAQECFIRVIMSWKKDRQSEFKWGNVLEILEMPIMGEPKLAMDVRSKLTSRFFPSPSYSLEPALSCPAASTDTFGFSTYPRNLIPSFRALHTKPFQ